MGFEEYEHLGKACRGDRIRSLGFRDNQLFFKRRKAGLD